MDEPRRRKNPILHSLVVITITRIRSQNAVEYRTRKLGPLLCFRRFAHEGIGSYCKARDRYEGVILTVRIGFAGFRLEKLEHQPRLADKLIAVFCSFGGRK